MVELFRAKRLITFSPIAQWRSQIGLDANAADTVKTDLEKAKLWAAHVDRAALRLPVSLKCLPQAIALSRILRAENIPHQVVIAHRKSETATQRDPDMLHAWLETGGQIVLGDLPGKWNEILRMPD